MAMKSSVELPSPKGLACGETSHVRRRGGSELVSTHHPGDRGWVAVPCACEEAGRGTRAPSLGTTGDPLSSPETRLPTGAAGKGTGPGDPWA